MGFRFRKSFGKGPFRVTVSKSGIGYSAGVKGFRVTKKAGGGTRTTASIPGTGISYVKDSGSGSSHRAAQTPIKSSPVSEPGTGGDRYCSNCYRKLQPDETVCPKCGRSNTGTTTPAKKPFYTRGWFILLVSLILLGSCTGGEGSEPKETTPEVTFPTVSITEATTPKTQQAVPTVDNSWMTEGSSINDPSGTTTYVLNTDSKTFHKPDCGHIDNISPENRKESNQPKHELIPNGYDPCGHCNP